MWIAGVEMTGSAAVLTFPHGLPGFERATRFVLRERASFAPVAFLECVDQESLCFLVAPVAALVEDYSISAAAEDLRAIGLDDSHQPVSGRDVLCLAILTAPQSGPLTANLLAPVVINKATNTAVQAVRGDNRYSHQHAVVALRSEATC
jgi:flagellar assembly factor FliW